MKFLNAFSCVYLLMTILKDKLKTMFKLWRLSPLKVKIVRDNQIRLELKVTEVYIIVVLLKETVKQETVKNISKLSL